METEIVTEMKCTGTSTCMAMKKEAVASWSTLLTSEEEEELEQGLLTLAQEPASSSMDEIPDSEGWWVLEPDSPASSEGTKFLGMSDGPASSERDELLVMPDGSASSNESRLLPNPSASELR